MFFEGFTKTGELSEKPWRVDAVVRLFASVIICVFAGGVVALAAGYFLNPANTKLVYFGFASASSLGCFVGALIVLGRPWPFENFLRDLVLTLALSYAGVLLTLWATSLRGDNAELKNTTLRTVLGILSLQGASFFLVCRFVREHGIGLAEAFGFNRRWKQSIVLGAMVTAIMVLVTSVMLQVIMRFLDFFHIEVQDQLPVQMVKQAHGRLDWWLLGIATIVIVPMSEELLFRGVLYPAIKRGGYPQLALWGSAFAFALIHWDVPRFLPLMALALALVWLYEYTGNLLSCITAHALFNAVGFVVVYYQNKLPPL
jgi:membrane protease YdiL (CAAX protease family)